MEGRGGILSALLFVGLAFVLVSAGGAGLRVIPGPSPLQAYSTAVPRPAVFAYGRWTDAHPSGSPGPASQGAIAYSPDADSLLLVPGAWTASNTSWIYDLNADTWTAVTPGPQPPGLALTSLVYDAAVRKFVLFGGMDAASPGFFYGSNWTYLFDPATQRWTNVSPAVSPPTRYGQAMAYVPSLGRILLFGGEHEVLDPSAPGGGIIYTVNDTWEYDAAADTWTNVTKGPAPSWNSGPFLWSEPRSSRVYLLDQVPGHTWAFNPSNDTWLQLTPEARGPLVDFAAMAYDAAAGSVVLFSSGFRTLGNTTWWFNATQEAWTAAASVGAPPGREMADMAYDSRAGVLVLYGGTNGTHDYTDTWIYRVLPPPALSATIEATALSSPTPFVMFYQAMPEGGIGPYTASWDFGDGSTATGTVAAHAYPGPGSYRVALTLMDATGNTTTARAAVTVVPPMSASYAQPLAGSFVASIGIVAAAAALAAVATYVLLRPKGPRKGA